MSAYRTIDQLWDLEEIKQLKASYCRFVDTKNWPALRMLFIDDATIDTRASGKFEDPDTWTKRVSERLPSGASLTVHHVHTPEITVNGHTATGIWQMCDYVDRLENGERRTVEGFGYYEETYRKERDQWKISSLQVVRIRHDEIPSVRTLGQGKA